MSKGYTMDDIKSIMDFDLMKMMLEVESSVLAYGFYRQIKENKQQGLLNLEKFMSSNIPKDKVPDFSDYGLSNEVLIKLSQQITKDQKIKKQMEKEDNLEQQNELQQVNENAKKLVKSSINRRAFIKTSVLILMLFTMSIMIIILLLAAKARI